MLRRPLEATAQACTRAYAHSIPTGVWRSGWARLITHLQPAGRTHGATVWRRWKPFDPTTTTTAAIARHVCNGAARRVFGAPQRRGFRLSAWRRNGGGPSKGASKGAEESLSLSARLKKLSKEYGWAAVGVYLGLSVLDFPFCFLLVRVVGTDKIGQVEHYIVSSARAVIPEPVRTTSAKYWNLLVGKTGEPHEHSQLSDGGTAKESDSVGWGLEQARERNKEEASLATQLALAYAIHKSFIFLRVPLTAAVTPKVVKLLRSWGWKIGKRT